MRQSMLESSHARLVAFVVLLAGIFGPVHAEKVLSGLYSGIFYSDSRQQIEAGGRSLFERSRGHLKLKLGYTITDYLDVEGQFGLTSDYGGGTGLMTFGAYLRPNKDFGDGKYKVYGLIGASSTEDENTITDLSESGMSVGGGIEIFGGKNITLGVEFIRLYSGKSLRGGDLTSDVLGFGITYYFQKETSVFDRNREKIDSIRY